MKKQQLAKLYVLAIVFVIFLAMLNVNTPTWTPLLIIADIMLIALLFFIRIYDDEAENRKKANKKIKELKRIVNEKENALDKLSKEHSEISEKLTNNMYELDKSQDRITYINSEMDSILNISKLITSTLNMEEAVETIYSLINNIVKCSRCVVLLEREESAFKKYEFGEKVTEKDILKNKAVMSVMKDHKGTLRKNVYLEGRDRVGDEMAVPIMYNNYLLGVLYAEAEEGSGFEFGELNFFGIIANYTGITIRNFEMLDNIYENQKKMERINQDLTTSQDELQKKNSELKKIYLENRKNYFSIIRVLVNAIEAKEPYTKGHCERVMIMSVELAKRLGFSPEELEHVRHAAILHDIGKIGIADEILNKPERLTDEEYDEIKKHPVIAYNILKDLTFLKSELEGIVQHHERYDGNGYPYGLKGNNICKMARVLAVADTYDAMTSDRPYRMGMTDEEATKEIIANRGTQFEPDVVDVFVEYIQEKMKVGETNE